MLFSVRDHAFLFHSRPDRPSVFSDVGPGSSVSDVLAVTTTVHLLRGSCHTLCMKYAVRKPHITSCTVERDPDTGCFVVADHGYYFDPEDIDKILSDENFMVFPASVAKLGSDVPCAGSWYVSDVSRLSVPEALSCRLCTSVAEQVEGIEVVYD